MNRVTRSEKLLNKLVDAGKLTPKGRDWLIAALDPMHDTQLQNLAGWPDLEDQASVVRCYKQSFTVNNSGAGANFDLVIQTQPIMNNRTVNNITARTNQVIAGLTGVTENCGALHWAVYNPGDFWTLANHSSVGHGVVSLPDSVVSGNGRLIGMGFEVINTTAEIYRQGTAYVWRSPQQENGTGTWGVSRAFLTDFAVDWFTGRQLQWCPPDEGAILLLPGSRTWEASKGAYCVVPFISVENPVTPANYEIPVATDAFDSSLRTTANSTNVFVPPPFTTTVAGSTLYGNHWPNKWAPVHSAGAAFTGLSNQSTLTITLNAYYEYFPASTDVNLVTLAKPSASYDPLALELYSIALSEMPVGVEAAMNGLGDWFAGIISRFAPMIGTLLSPLTGPAGPAIGLGAKALADSYLTSQSPQNAPSKAVVLNRNRRIAPTSVPRVAIASNPRKGKKKKKKKNMADIDRQIAILQALKSA